MAFAGISQHRCKGFGEDDGPDGLWYACPPELCEADRLVARIEQLERSLAEAEAFRVAELLHVEQAERERDEARAENTIMRGLLAKQDTPCVYCGAETMATCPRGFPGCAQADDLLVGDDETMRRLRVERDEALCKPVVARWLDSHHAEASEARVAQLEGALAPLASPFPWGEPEAKWFEESHRDIEIDCCVTITYADVERARAALDAARPADTKEEA